MNEEFAFVQGLIDQPADDALRLVYSDWLEEQGDPESLAKAEFLRLTVRSAGEEDADRLRRLAADLDPEWLAPASRLAVENCPVERAHAARSFLSKLLFRKRCTRRWESLEPTPDPTVRHCDDCSRKVHYCGTIMEARDHASIGNCIAVDLGILRRKGDLVSYWDTHVSMGEPQSAMREPAVEMGELAITAEEPQDVDVIGMLLDPEDDPVSLERERRKREKEADGA